MTENPTRDATAAPSPVAQAADASPAPAAAAKVRLRPIGGQDYEVCRGGEIAGTAHFERYRTSQGVTVRAWIDRPGHETMQLNPGYFEDFARTVRQLFV